VSEQDDDSTDKKTTQCRRCGCKIVVIEDEWWSHRWNEEPSSENVEQALEKPDEFRDWFQENTILCPDCHKTVIEVILDGE